MRAKIILVCALLLPSAVANSQGGASNSQQAPDAAYRATMKAQYEARAPAPPMRADEAQRIYDGYLNTIGRQDNRRIPEDETDDTRSQRWPGP